jgi:hypothetical protein
LNRVQFRVDNRGATAVSGLRLYVSTRVDGTVKQHQSDIFAVEAGAFTHVPVVIGGYAKLDGIVDLDMRLEKKLSAQESINILQKQSQLVTNASLLPTLVTEEFTRGGSGTVIFSLENTSDVETEIIMATQNGIEDSNEVRLILEDTSGNVLSVQPIKQYTGNVISIAGGVTVARIPPGERFTSAPIQISVPSAAPDQVNLRLVIDKFHHHLGRESHVAIEGSVRLPIWLKSPLCRPASFMAKARWSR